MKSTIVIYGSSTGTCEDVAKKIAGKLGCEAVDVQNITADTVRQHDNLILGTSTWGAGDMQDDWYSGLEMLKKLDLTGKTVALFGCGESGNFPDTFCGGMSEIYNAVAGKGARLIGQVDASSYNYSDSASVVDGKFVGLAIDVDEGDDTTSGRIADWTAAIAPQL